MEWILRLECRDTNRVLHQRDVTKRECPTDVSTVIMLVLAGGASE